MSRLNGPVLGILTVLCSAMPISMAACEDDPDDLNYLKAGSGGSSTTGGNAGSQCKCGECNLKCVGGTGGRGGNGSGGNASGGAGKAGASSDADAG